MKTIKATEDEFDFNASGSSAEAFDVFATIKEAISNSPAKTYSPSVWRWRGGYISVPAGHPVPKSAELVCRWKVNKWDFENQFAE